MPREILQLVLQVQQLKQVHRTGWNMRFPAGHRFKTRCVPEAESVAGHSYSLALYAFGVAMALGLDVQKMVLMALVHDAPEVITSDIVTATLSSADKARAIEDKRSREYAAARTLFLAHGEFGARCFALWTEYEKQATLEARLVGQLDKIECAAQAVQYAQQGHRLDSEEFIVSAESVVAHPLLVDMIALIREEHERGRRPVRRRGIWERIVVAWKTFTE